MTAEATLKSTAWTYTGAQGSKSIPRIQMSSGLCFFCNVLLRVLQFTLECQKILECVLVLYHSDAREQLNSLRNNKGVWSPVKLHRGCAKVFLIHYLSWGKKNPIAGLSNTFCFPSHPILSYSLCNPVAFLTEYSPLWKS